MPNAGQGLTVIAKGGELENSLTVEPTDFLNQQTRTLLPLRASSLLGQEKFRLKMILSRVIGDARKLFCVANLVKTEP